MITAGSLALRRGVLAVSVLHDVDVLPDDDGVTLPGRPDVHVGWGECLVALAGQDPEQPLGRARLAHHLLARRWSADLDRADLEERLRPAGLMAGHALHPGPGWVRRSVLGGALDLGLGAVDLDPHDPDRVVLLPDCALDAAGVDAGLAWERAHRMLEDLGGLAAERARRDPKGILRPMGDCDVVTLLGARSLRTALADDNDGLAGAAVPMRRRGWTRLALIDPAFAAAAAAATPVDERGFPRPLLITPDEVTMVPDGGSAEVALRDGSASTPWVRDMLFR